MTTDAASELLQALEDRGYKYYTGVPCSLLGNVFKLLEHNVAGRYIPAVREDCAVGVAAGLQLAGAKCAVLMQNSGLGYCLNPLMSLSELYGLPLLMIIGWRGAHANDAPEHAAVGARLTDLLTAAAIRHVILARTSVACSVSECSDLAQAAAGPVALLVPDAI